MSSSPEKPSNPPQARNERLMATLSEAASTKATDIARQEVTRAIEAQGGPPSSDPAPMKRHDSSGTIKAVKTEVTEAAVRFTEGVDVITETLLLILGKFQTLRRLTMVGMIFGGCVLITCLMLTIRITRTAVLQEKTTADIASQEVQLRQVIQKLNAIQESTTDTAAKVEEVNSKPSIEIVPDKGKPGKAKVVIRSSTPPVAAAPSASPPRPKTAAAGAKPAHDEMVAPPAPAADIVEIPIQIPAK